MECLVVQLSTPQKSMWNLRIKIKNTKAGSTIQILKNSIGGITSQGVKNELLTKCIMQKIRRRNRSS